MGWFNSFKIDLSKCRKVTGQELRKIIFRSDINRAYSYRIKTFDRDYYLPTKDQIDYIMNKCPSNIYKYRPEERDCDDFARIFRGYLSEKGYGNIALGLCTATSGSKSHAFILGVTNDNKIVFIEPQNDRKMDINEWIIDTLIF